MAQVSAITEVDDIIPVLRVILHPLIPELGNQNTLFIFAGYPEWSLITVNALEILEHVKPEESDRN